MTFVGKILVIVIMAFALLFLGLSTVVFTTSANWKEAADKANASVKKITAEKSNLSGDLDKAKTDLDRAIAEGKAEAEKAKGSYDALQGRLVDAEKDRDKYRKDVEVAQQNARTALDEAEHYRKETDRLRTEKSAVDKVANDYKLQQTELNDRIRELERMNRTLDDNTKDLREKVARFSTLLRQHGLSDDISTVKGQASPPRVEGQVSRVDPTNRRVEITIGSDDGLVAGHELYLFRRTPRPEYLGRIQILSVDPDQAVGKVIGNTVSGKKIQEGDIVSSTIRPRS